MSGDRETPRGIDDADRRIIAATQAGLPLTPRPYRDVAAAVGLTEDDVIERIRRMQSNGAVRRMGAVPDHYALGYRANGMSVWDVADAVVGTLGPRIGALDFVSHCYRRRRHPPEWRYNLFAMVHGRDRATVEKHVREIATILGSHSRDHRVIYSRRILKKTGLRIDEGQ